MAYRSVLRPSSPLSAKASTRCPYRRLVPADHVPHGEEPPQQKQSITKTLSRSGPNPPPPRQEDMTGQRGPERLGHSLTPIHDVQHSRTSPPSRRSRPNRFLPQRNHDPSSLRYPLCRSGRRPDRSGQWRLVEADGIEPTTPCLQSRCSPS